MLRPRPQFAHASVATLRERTDADRLLSPEPAEHEHRQADGVDDGRRVSQVASNADEEPSPIAGVQLRCESTTIVLRCHLRHRPRHRPRCPSRDIDFRARRLAGAEDTSGVGARTHRASRRHQSPFTSSSSSAHHVVEPVASKRSNDDRRADRTSDGHRTGNRARNQSRPAPSAVWPAIEHGAGSVDGIGIAEGIPSVPPAPTTLQGPQRLHQAFRPHERRSMSRRDIRRSRATVASKAS